MFLDLQAPLFARWSGTAYSPVLDCGIIVEVRVKIPAYLREGSLFMGHVFGGEPGR